MALKTSPFPNGFAAGIHAVGWVFILPCFWCLNHLLAVCHPTTQEQTQQLEQECYLYPLKAFFGSIILFILFLTTAPLAFLGFLLWAPVQAYRRPFCYYRAMQSSPEKETHRGFELVGKASFGFVTANVCLLPEAIARFNNIGHTRRRAAAIGQHIVQGVCRPDIQIFVDSPSSCGTLSPSSSIFPVANSYTYGATDRQAQPLENHYLDSSTGNVAMPCDVTEESWAESPSVLLSSNQNPNQQGQMVHRSAHRALLSQGLHQQDDVPWEVSSMFPASVDIVCLEEVFDKGAAQKLIQALRPVFGHILYDVGVYACYPPCRCSSFKFMNSGLFLASRFPVLEARYCCFPNCCWEDALAAKGLLSAKGVCRPDIHSFADSPSSCGTTANVCLLPEGLSRFNNLAHTQRRAAAIGQHIVQGVCRPDIQIFVDSPSSCGTLSPSSSIFPVANSYTYGATDRQAQPLENHYLDSSTGNVAMPCDVTEESWAESPSVLLSSNQNPNQQGQMVHRSAHRALLSQGLHQQDDVPWEVSSMFPASVDIVCLEEVFDKGAAQKLIQALRPVFGHILYDVGVYACYPPCRCSSFKFMNSGLFLASRFPVLEARYCCFPNCRGEDALAAKGLLSAKVLIGQNQKRKKVVGYINCTHLDAPEGDGQIRYEQLNMITKWTGDFQTAYRQPDEDVAFDVLCGDFNFDNCSPGDAREQNHCLFEEYRDPCRAGPGKEKPWAIGTLLEQPTLYEDDVNTPENLQRYAQFPCLQFTVFSLCLCQPWIGRRIDYILYRESTISKHCRTEIEAETLITQLAGLTDHIPVGLRLNVTMNSDCIDE
uniref:sphingomyelin phosphodiesterase 5 n=1 Tax=Monopterus albus TaxID=43700 RepID=UPI0009B4BCFE|nr:sphingomyelin phosphodiesterase 5-like [Monopterus albus]